MKRIERHKLKENEFARTVAHARDVITDRQREITTMIVVAVVALAAVGGYLWWRNSRAGHANAAFAAALATYEAPVVPPAAPAPGSPAPLPQPGTFQSEQAKLDAALPKFLEAAEKYPSSNAGIAARYYAAGILAGLGRAAEAEQRFKEVSDRAGDGIYGRTARLGMAEAQVAQGKYDQAIAIYTELSRDTNSRIPVDSVLMQLGRAYVRAGKKEEAVRAFNRIVEEFPQSLYLSDARREMEEARKTS
ncbi:MAG: tetratricopeptide repeat protein [Vicinamibacterales bacterium]